LNIKGTDIQSVLVFDENGKQLISQENEIGERKLIVDLSFLAAGTYIPKAVTIRGSLAKTVVKN